MQAQKPFKIAAVYTDNAWQSFIGLYYLSY